ncbi:MAG: serine hydrolase domain-containing protein [Myxococcota bacterium]
MVIKPEAAGMCADRLERVTRHIERRYIEPGKIAGCQVLVARHGHVTYFRSFGQMDLERQKPLRDDTIFRIYSMTKPITSVALMALYEHGHFQLADPVQRFIPEWEGLEVYESGSPEDFKTRPCERPMTVRDVLMHTSGLSYGGDPDHPVDAAYQQRGLRTHEGATLESLVKELASIPLKFSPGTRWHYSYSTDVCARLVEVISGQRFDAYLDEHVFGPLQMVDTGFTVPPEKVDRFAANYGRRRDRTLMLMDDPAKSMYLKPRSFLSGGGGLVSTTSDYLRFCQMLLNGGELEGERILGRKTIELMTRNHLPGGQDLAGLAFGGFSETPYGGVGFGLGFAVSLGDVATQAVGSESNYYWGGAASTIFWNDAIEDLVVIFMTQLMPSNTFNFRGQLKNLVYPAIVDAGVPRPLSAASRHQ